MSLSVVAPMRRRMSVLRALTPETNVPERVKMQLGYVGYLLPCDMPVDAETIVGERRFTAVGTFELRNPTCVVEVAARHAEATEQYGGNNRLPALDRQQRHEVLTHAGLDVGAKLKLPLLVHKQCDLLGDLAHGLFTCTFELAKARRREGTSGPSSTLAAQRADDLTLLGIAQQ